MKTVGQSIKSICCTQREFPHPYRPVLPHRAADFLCLHGKRQDRCHMFHPDLPYREKSHRAGFGNKQEFLYEPLNTFLSASVGGRPV